MADRKDQELDAAVEEFYFRIWEQAPMGKRDVLSLTNEIIELFDNLPASFLRKIEAKIKSKNEVQLLENQG